MPPAQNAPFDTRFFPQHVLLLSVEENMFPMGYWTVISKDPFRFLICVQNGNYSLDLIRKYREAALHFMPWSDRERVVQAGYLTGREGPKAPRLGYTLKPAAKLTHTRLVEGADAVYETVIHSELEGLSTEFSLFVMDVIVSHGAMPPALRKPIFYQSLKDFATVGDRWKYQR